MAFVHPKISQMLLLIGLFLSVYAEEQCNREVVSEGCTVLNSSAHCTTWDLVASINGLPSCVTHLNVLFAGERTVTEDRYNMTYFNHLRFSGLPNLEEVNISTNPFSHHQLFLVINHLEKLKSLQNVRTWRMNVPMKIILEEESKGIFSHMKALEVLDLTRAFHAGLSAVEYVLGEDHKIKKLVLKNIQQIDGEFYNSILNFDSFGCGEELEHLDLSYNDIIGVSSSTFCVPSKLRYLNLDHNLLISSPHFSTLRYTFAALTSIEVIRFDTWSGLTYQEGLWDDPPDFKSQHEDSARKHYSLLQQALSRTKFSFLVGYGSWLEDLLTHCSDSPILKIVRCMWDDTLDQCGYLQCINTQLNVTECRALIEYKQPAYLMETCCQYDAKCYYNMTIPLPPYLREIHAHNFLKFSTSVYTLHPTSNESVVCVHPDNNLQVIDLPNINLVPAQTFPGVYGVSGLRKLRYINIQGHRLPVLLDQMVFHDMFELTELHVGGSKMMHDDILSESWLQAFYNVEKLNLSNAQLIAIQPNAFTSLTKLSVLDLSFNRLSLGSLELVDWSHTSLKSLNLSHNHLVALPEMTRNHLDAMEGLELYLSGNNFLCNCGNLAFLTWVQASREDITFHYSGDHVCADSPGNTIHDIEIDALHCNWYWVQPLIIVFSLLAGASIACGAYGLYRKRWFIANMYFRFQERFFLGSDDTDSNVNYKYDAFVLYSSVDDDRVWVHFKLVRELEETYGFRLCVHHRDFLAGRDIVDNIEKAIRSSRKVLVVMSENFLRSDWCVQEIQMTSSVDRKKFVVIMYKDVLLSPIHIPTAIRHLLEDITYVEWNEQPPQAQELFWKKLRRALYNKQKFNSDEMQTMSAEEMLLH